MKNFFDKKKAGGFKGGKKFGGGGWQRDEARGSRPTLYRATCNECHAPCEVPFHPTGQRPVYCRGCFRPSDGESSFKKPSYSSSSSRPNTSSNDEVVKQLKALNNKMDQLLEAISGFEVVKEDEE